MPDVTTSVPGAFREPGSNAADPRKPRIVVVGHLVGDVVYGAERSLLELLAAIDQRKYELSCVFPSENDAYLAAVAKYTKNISVFPYQWWSKTRLFDEETVARFEAILRRERADLIHVNTITLMDPLLAARRLGMPSIVHARELIDRDENLAKMFGEEPAAIVRRVQDTADFIIANSDATYRLYRTVDRCFRLYNSVDVDRFDLPNELEPGKLKVGIISSNQPKKGVEPFFNLAALARRDRPELEFLVIGPRTELSDRLEQMAHGEAGHGNLRFLGYIADSVEAIRQINVLVSFSIVAESFGRTIAEAMAARRPVIAYRWGAAPELIRHGRDGFLIPYLDFAKALEHLATLADHPDRVHVMGLNGRQRAELLLSPEAFAAKLSRIYRQIFRSWKAHERDKA